MMYRFKGFTEKANTALNLAIESAQQLGHTYIGTEHIVLGLLKEGTGVAASVLEMCIRDRFWINPPARFSFQGR